MQNQRRKVKCRMCGIYKLKIKTNRKGADRGFVYVDVNGKRWYAKTCPECKKGLDLQYKRQKGQLGVDGHTHGPVFTCRRNELIAKDYLRSIGFTKLRLGNGKGPDIFGYYYGKPKLIEVKTVFKQRRNNGLFVNPVTPQRLTDDGIVYVHGTKCYLTTMQEHLTRVGKTGSAAVTKYFKGAK